MTLTIPLPHPSRCFCQVSLVELEKWFVRHYEQGVPTMKLLESAANVHERELISIVALFELDDPTLLKMMGNVDLPEHHILHCREYFREKLNHCRTT